MILAAYKHAPAKRDYINELVSAVEKHRPVSLWLIREFARNLTLEDNAEYNMYESAYNLYELCRAANMRSGKALIAHSDIAMLELHGRSGAKVPTEEDRLKMAQYEGAVRRNFERIRQKLLWSLKAAKVAD